MVWLRRQFVLNPSTEVEYKMRTELYSRLQTLPVSFHDRWGSGQLLSRMMQDIGLIRRWLAFGLVLLVVNVLTIIIGSVLLFRWHWLLGTIFLVTAIPLWIRGYLFEKRYGALTRRSQDQAGDLATSVEESVHGIRVLKAFGRGKHALSRFSRQAETLRETEMSKAGAIASIWFWLDMMPQIAFGLSLMSGIWLISVDQIGEAQLFAFFAMAVVLRWPIESIGFLFSFMLDARTATDPRVRHLLRDQHHHGPGDPRAHREPSRRARVRERPLPVSGRRCERARSARRHRSGPPPRRDHGAGRSHRQRQDHAHDAAHPPV